MKGNPNDESMKNYFIAKVWDSVDEEYKPLYVLPDATDEVKGGVYLTDELTGDSAATGVTAMTPQGVDVALDELIRVDWHEPDAEIYPKCKLWIQPPPPYFTYALTIDSTNSDPESAVTYIDKLSGHGSGWDAWKDDKLFNEIKPCVLSSDGSVKYYLQKDDYTKKEDGSPSNLSGSDGDVMVQIPLLGYYLHYEDDILHVELTNEPNKENFCYYAHSLDNPGDCDYIYIGAYLLSGSSSTVKTVSGQSPRVSTTMTNFRTYVQNKGDGNQLLSWYVWNLMQVLYLIVYKNLNSQSALGMGYVTSNSAVTTTGQTDSTGFCSNSGNSTDGKHQVKCLGIEDFWGNARQWCDGIYCDSSYNILTDYKNFHNTGSGYQFSESSGFASSGSNYIKKAAGNNSRAFLPIDKTNGLTGGSSSTYFCDYCDVVSSCVALVGGYCFDETRAGAFFCYLTYSASGTSSYLGAREVYKHKAV